MERWIRTHLYVFYIITSLAQGEKEYGSLSGNHGIYELDVDIPILALLIGGGLVITVACDFVQIKHFGYYAEGNIR